MDELLARCLAFLQPQPVEAYLVGGTVRDQLLGRASHDIDLVVPRDALRIAREMANALGGAFYPLDAERETGRIILPDRVVIDVAIMRGGDLFADLAARDFTINALARPVANPTQLIDPHRGADDLRRRLIRAVTIRTFQDDPVRVLRAVRLAVALRFTIYRPTEKLMFEDARFLPQVGGERVRDELTKILDLGQLGLFRKFGLPRVILPHAQSNDAAFRAFEHVADLAGGASRQSASVASALGEWGQPLDDYLHSELSAERTRLTILKLAALYPSADDVSADMRALKFSRHEIEFARALLRHSSRFAQIVSPVDALAVHRFFRDTGAAALGLVVMALARDADTSRVAPAPAGAGASAPTRDTPHAERTWAIARALLAVHDTARDTVIAPAPLLNGAELAERFGLQGAQIGEALKNLVEAQVSGTVQTRDDAQRYVRDWKRETENPKPQIPTSNNASPVSNL